LRADLQGVLLVASIAALTSCASSSAPGDRAFASGDYVAASASYQSTLARNPASPEGNALRFRLALIFLLPESPLHDGTVGRALFAKLASDPAAGGYHDAATFVLGLQSSLESAETTADLCAAEISRLDGEVKAQESAGKAREDVLQHLRASLAEAQAQVHRLQDELRALKNIDLGRKP